MSTYGSDEPDAQALADAEDALTLSPLPEAQAWMDACPDDMDVSEMHAVVMNRVQPLRRDA